MRSKKSFFLYKIIKYGRFIRHISKTRKYFQFSIYFFYVNQKKPEKGAKLLKILTSKEKCILKKSGN